MTSKERVLCAIGHEEPDRLPTTLYLDPDLKARLMDEPEGRSALSLIEDDTLRILWELEAEIIDQTSFRDPFGVLWKRAGTAYFHRDPPMRTPDVHKMPRIRLLPAGEEERIRQLRRENPEKFIYYQLSLTFGERLWALRGFEQYLADLVENPTFVHKALDVLLEMHLEAIEALIRLPINGITFGDDFGSQKGMMISPACFREFYKDRLALLYSTVRDAGLVAGAHSCGDNTEIMGDYVDIGLQVFHPLQPECMDIREIKREYGRDLTFRGGIGTQGAVVRSTPEQVRAYVVDSVRVLAEGGGYLMEPGKPLPSEMTTENAIAFIEAMCEARQMTRSFV